MKRAALEKLCMSLPGTTKDIKWGNDLIFSVGGKMYCGTAATGPESGVSFKVSEPLFDILTKRKGIIPAPYAARFHWIYVEDPSVLKKGELESLIKGSHRLVASKLPRKKQRELGLLEEEGATKPATGRRSKRT